MNVIQPDLEWYTGVSAEKGLPPGGTDVKFNAVTVDVYPTWDSIFNGDFQHFYDLWRKAHPDMEVGTMFEQYDKLRHQGDIDIFVAQNYITGTR
jgi:hypothetical protein